MAVPLATFEENGGSTRYNLLLRQAALQSPPEQLCSRRQRVTEVSQWRTAHLLVRRTALSSAVVAAVVAQLAVVELIKCAFLYFTDFDACSKNELALVPYRGLALQRVSHNAQALPSFGPSCYSVNLRV